MELGTKPDPRRLLRCLSVRSVASSRRQNDADGGVADSADERELYKQAPELAPLPAGQIAKLRAHFGEGTDDRSHEPATGQICVGQVVGTSGGI
jgi:hypothetical protein